MKMDKIKAIQLFSCLYAFLLTLILVILFISAGAGFGILNSKSIIRNMNESNYYSMVYEELYAKTSQELEAAGFPKTLMKNVITQERVYISSKNYAEATLNSENTEIKTDRITQDLTNKLEQYRKAKGIILTAEQEVEVTKLVGLVEKDYVAAINLPLLQSIVECRANYLSSMMYLLPILILLVIVLCYFLLRMYHYLHRGLRFIAYAVISASSLILAMAGYLMITKAYEDVMAEPEYYQSFIRMYLRWDINVFLYIGGLGMILALVLISFISYLKNRMKNN